MSDDLQLNVSLLRRRVPNLTTAARNAGLRPATVSNLCTGKTPVGRAEVRTLVTLASLAGCSLDELIIRGSGVAMIETGIKVLDLFSPVVRGGTVGLVARPGMGQLVVITELFRRLKKREYVTVFWKPKEDAVGIDDVGDEADSTYTTLDEVYQQISSFRDERDVLLGADRSVVLSGELLTLQERLEEDGGRPVTIALVDIVGEAVDEEVPYGPLDTRLQFDMDLSTRGLFPAIDPILSTSTVLEGAYLEATHLTIQQRARKLLRRYRELRSLVNVRGLEKLSETDQLTYRRGERLEAFLTQPFYVAEEFTKKAGKSLTLQETLDGVRRILDGAADDMEVDQLTYIGQLANKETT
jgi:F-type H+-transporting ATPase subunit beta